MLGYAVIRFGIEFLRDDPRGNTLGGLPPGQLSSIGVVGAGAILCAKLKDQPLIEV